MRPKRVVRCTYLVALESDASDDEIRVLAAHLSGLRTRHCEVIVVDPAPAHAVESHRRVLRWVGRYVAVAGEIDRIQIARELARSDKIIVATPEARCTAAEIDAMSNHLDRCEVVEPEEFVEPVTWWSGIEAGRMLLHRGIDQPAERSIFAFRKSARDLVVHRAGLYLARDVFVRREPPPFRARKAASLLFLAVIPLLILIALVGGFALLSESAAAMVFASVLVALRGRSGAAEYFPVYSCFFAPLWIAEQSVTAYWGLVDRMRGAKPSARRESLESLGLAVVDAEHRQ